VYVRYLCSPHHSGSALYPVIRRMERAAGFEPGDDQQARLDKLDTLLTQTSASAEDRAIFAELLSEEPQMANVSPLRRRMAGSKKTCGQVANRRSLLRLEGGWTRGLGIKAIPVESAI